MPRKGVRLGCVRRGIVARIGEACHANHHYSCANSHSLANSKPVIHPILLHHFRMVPVYWLCKGCLGQLGSDPFQRLAEPVYGCTVPSEDQVPVNRQTPMAMEAVLHWGQPFADPGRELRGVAVSSRERSTHLDAPLLGAVSPLLSTRHSLRFPSYPQHRPNFSTSL